MSSLKDLLGDVVQGKSGNVDVDSLIAAKKVIGLYFSAHWCPPCRGFTPELIKFYNKNKDAKNFEIIFISSDRDEDSFNGYYADMPWLVLPFSDRSRKQKVSEKFNVTGIPSLIMLDHNGALLNKNARGQVMDDPDAEDFPWSK